MVSQPLREASNGIPGVCDLRCWGVVGRERNSTQDFVSGCVIGNLNKYHCMTGIVSWR